MFYSLEIKSINYSINVHFVRVVYKKPSYCWDSQPFVAIFRT